MIEIRSADVTKIELLKDLSEGFGTYVGLGSECCVHRLPSAGQVAAAMEHTCELTVVTPITPQKHYNWMIEYISTLPHGIRLVVNDAGVLYSLHKNGLLGKFSRIVAGRGIVHTSEACPWVDHLLRDESELVRAAFLQTNLNYSKTLKFFTALGISAMETDLQSRTIRAAAGTGLPVAGHLEYIAVSYARSCHTARFYKEQPPGCTARCNTHLELRLVDMFDLSAVPPGFAQPSPEMADIYPVLYLLGATIFMKSGCRDFQGLERVIINADMYDAESLKEIVLTAKKIIA